MLNCLLTLDIRRWIVDEGGCLLEGQVVSTVSGASFQKKRPINKTQEPFRHHFKYPIHCFIDSLGQHTQWNLMMACYRYGDCKETVLLWESPLFNLHSHQSLDLGVVIQALILNSLYNVENRSSGPYVWSWSWWRKYILDFFSKLFILF